MVPSLQSTSSSVLYVMIAKSKELYVKMKLFSINLQELGIYGWILCSRSTISKALIIWVC